VKESGNNPGTVGRLGKESSPGRGGTKGAD
jgi:hypothetical protein